MLMPSYDNIDPNSTDLNLASVDITPDTYNLIPVLQSILEINPDIKILGSPWYERKWCSTLEYLLEVNLDVRK